MYRHCKRKGMSCIKCISNATPHKDTTQKSSLWCGVIRVKQGCAWEAAVPLKTPLHSLYLQKRKGMSCGQGSQRVSGIRLTRGQPNSIPLPTTATLAQINVVTSSASDSPKLSMVVHSHRMSRPLPPASRGSGSHPGVLPRCWAQRSPDAPVFAYGHAQDSPAPASYLTLDQVPPTAQRARAKWNTRFRLGPHGLMHGVGST